MVYQAPAHLCYALFLHTKLIKGQVCALAGLLVPFRAKCETVESVYPISGFETEHTIELNRPEQTEANVH